ncbi:MAG: PAS domain-containing protein, partial [Bacteroidales bacterium]|nr:PAS domain-containing protein [Bacteroidales bacterium]
MNKHELENRIKELEAELIEEKRQTQSLKEGETKFQSISNYITTYISYINADNLKYEFVNSLFEKSFGIPREKIIGSHLKDVIGEKNYEFALKYIKEVKSGKTVSYENTFDIASGKRWIQVNYSPVFDDNSKVIGIAMVGYDITERKQVEEALAQNNNSLNKLNHFALELSKLSSNDNLEAFIAKQIKEITGAKLALFSEYNSADRTITNKHIEGKDGLIKKVINLLGTKTQNIQSIVSEEIYKEMTNELIGVRRTLHEMSFGAVSRPVGAAIQAFLKVDRFIGLAYLIEGELYGTSVLAMGKGQPDPQKEILENFIHLASVSLRRKQADIALLESERKYITTLSVLPDMLFYLNNKGTFLDCQFSKFDELLFEKEAFIGKTIHEIMPPAIATQGMHAISKALGTDSLQIFEYALDLPKGKQFYEMRIVRFAPNEILGIARNITDKTKAELIIQQQNEELKKLNIDKDRFISILGHDLRSPFNNLLGLSELLTKNIHYYDIDKIEKLANGINISARNTCNLMDDLLMWTSSQQGSIVFKPQNLSLTDICNDVLITLNPTADAKKIVINCLAEDNFNVFADADMLKTILRNLVSNAIKFTNNDGTININAEQNSENVTILISDNGIGISPDN